MQCCIPRALPGATMRMPTTGLHMRREPLVTRCSLVTSHQSTLPVISSVVSACPFVVPVEQPVPARGAMPDFDASQPKNQVLCGNFQVFWLDIEGFPKLIAYIVLGRCVVTEMGTAPAAGDTGHGQMDAIVTRQHSMCWEGHRVPRLARQDAQEPRNRRARRASHLRANSSDLYAYRASTFRCDPWPPDDTACP